MHSISFIIKKKACIIKKKLVHTNTISIDDTIGFFLHCQHYIIIIIIIDTISNNRNQQTVKQSRTKCTNMSYFYIPKLKYIQAEI